MSHIRRAAGRATGRREFITNNQTTAQIINQMKRAEYHSRNSSKRLVPAFKKSEKERTTKVLFNYLQKKLEYKKEKGKRQTAKTISRHLSDGFGDCKHYTTTAVGILNACGIPAWFVLVSQHRWKLNPNHAYAQCIIDGDIVTFDPCRTYDSECKFFHKYRFLPYRQNQLSTWR